MQQLIDFWPYLVMALLVGASAFFSASEAALFYLRREDRHAFHQGNPAQRVAAALLNRSDRLLTGVLFYNLTVNLTYFAVSSFASIRLERAGRTAEAGFVAIGSLLAIIFFSELLPKSVAVSWTRSVAAAVAIPLAAMLRIVDGFLSVLQFATLLSRRLLWPGFAPEPFLELTDLERSIDLSTSDARLQSQERNVLENIVQLSELRLNELMRPRASVRTFLPPVTVGDLHGELTSSGYAFVSEPESGEIVAAIPLARMSEIPAGNLERFSEPVVYLPWCTHAAGALDLLRERDRRVVAVVNEFGETIGVLTFEDIVETIFHSAASRSMRMLKEAPMSEFAPGRWQVNGMTTLRRLRKYFDFALPQTKAVTVAGVLQESLERMPVRGDVCSWGPVRFYVADVPIRGPAVVEMTCEIEEGESP